MSFTETILFIPVPIAPQLIAELDPQSYGRPGWLNSPYSFDVQMSLSAAPIAKHKHRSALFAYGPTRDAFLFKLFLLLGHEAADKIV
jgi:hypothetical protein